MAITTLAERLKDLLADPEATSIATGIAADAAVMFESPQEAALAKLNEELAAGVDQFCVAEPTRDTHRAYICGLLSGVSIIASVLERRLQKTATAEAAKTIAQQKLHARVLQALYKNALSNQQLSESLKVDAGQMNRAVKLLFQHELIRLLPIPLGGDKREKLYRLTSLGLQQVSQIRHAPEKNKRSFGQRASSRKNRRLRTVEPLPAASMQSTEQPKGFSYADQTARPQPLTGNASA